MRSRAVSLPAACCLLKTRLAAAQLGAAFEVGQDSSWEDMGRFS